jgi:hypothetical protein
MVYQRFTLSSDKRKLFTLYPLTKKTGWELFETYTDAKEALEQAIHQKQKEWAEDIFSTKEMRKIPW